ncbi:hypothetical protein F7725_016065 [Dissostichus mawsoni]|uniref:Uncharacterized protein n=1 Tax=Dissostichus mawsoni TaxID=36200 RepID=A0A7J5Y5V1_DISMA|nr:hypothetical protein F7725_016065 [Dissostichus mawsoni]
MALAPGTPSIIDVWVAAVALVAVGVGMGGLRSGREGVCVEMAGLYCDACEVGLSLLLSWLEGALLFQGELEPSAGELLKLSSSSMPLAASNCVFSSRVIRRSSSSPNSPPISVGSPTTITSCRDAKQEAEPSMYFPPPLMVLPPDILRFRRLFGACLDGSAAEKR